MNCIIEKQKLKRDKLRRLYANKTEGIGYLCLCLCQLSRLVDKLDFLQVQNLILLSNSYQPEQYKTEYNNHERGWFWDIITLWEPV